MHCTNSLKQRPKNCKTYTCPMCAYPFEMYNNFVKHFNKEHQQKSLICIKCNNDKSPRQIEEYIKHLRNEHNIHKETDILECIDNSVLRKINQESALKCLLCNQSFTKLLHLFEHLTNDHFYCYVCSIVHNCDKDFFDHQMKHTFNEVKLYKCKECPIESVSLSFIKNHIKLSHEKLIIDKDCYDEATSESSSHITYPNNGCPYCLYDFEIIYDTYAHLKNHQLINCQDCKRIVITTTKDSSVMKQCTICERNDIIKEENDENLKAEQQKQLQTIEVPVLDKNNSINDTDTKNKKEFINLFEYPCLFCDFRGKIVNIANHLSSEHNYCRICDILYECQESFNEHKQAHDDCLVYFNHCKYCFNYFLNDIDNHIVTEHRNEVIKKSLFKMQQSTYLMDTSIPIPQEIINISYKKKQIKTIPLENEMKLQNFTQCPYCFVHLYKGYQQRHLLKTHNIIKCNSCNKFYRSDGIITNDICNICLKLPITDTKPIVGTTKIVKIEDIMLGSISKEMNPKIELIPIKLKPIDDKDVPSTSTNKNNTNDKEIIVLDILPNKNVGPDIEIISIKRENVVPDIVIIPSKSAKIDETSNVEENRPIFETIFVKSKSPKF